MGRQAGRQFGGCMRAWIAVRQCDMFMVSRRLLNGPHHCDIIDVLGIQDMSDYCSSLHALCLYDAFMDGPILCTNTTNLYLSSSDQGCVVNVLLLIK